MPPDRNLSLCAGPLLLRPPQVEDVDAIYEAADSSRDQLSRWMPWCHAEYCRDDTWEFISSRAEAWERDVEYALLITRADDGRVLGMTGLNQLDRLQQRANLGYWVRTSETGRNVATIAARRVARWGFDVLGLERIEIVAAVGNLASQRVAEKVGAYREGILRCRLRLAEVQHDAVCYSLIPSDHCEA